jgi:hypothetical protein
MMSGFLKAVLESLRNSVDHVIMSEKPIWVVLMQDTACLPELFWPVLSELLSECLFHIPDDIVFTLLFECPTGI